VKGSPCNTPDVSWCSGHKSYLPTSEFARSARAGYQGHCRECHRLYMAQWRARGCDRDMERYRIDAGVRKKVRARSRMRMRIYRGIQPRQPCSRCGNPKAEMHHPDYDKPTEVQWLCAKCHGAEHYPEAQRAAAAVDGLAALARKYANR